MEDLCQRFPHLAEGIFNSVDSQSFLNCLIASKSLVSCVEQEKFFQVRKITENIEKFHTLVEKEDEERALSLASISHSPPRPRPGYTGYLIAKCIK